MTFHLYQNVWNYTLGRDYYPKHDELMGLIKAHDLWENDIGFRNRAKYNLSGTWLLGDFLKFEDYQKYWNDYFSNRPVDWADVKYPTLMSGSGQASKLWDTDPASLLRLYQ